MEQHPIANTPFTALKYDGKWYLTMGKYRLTKELQNKEKCIYESKNASWNRLMQVIQIMIDNNHENQKNSQKTNEINNGTKQNTNQENTKENTQIHEQK